MYSEITMLDQLRHTKLTTAPRSSLLDRLLLPDRTTDLLTHLVRSGKYPVELRALETIQIAKGKMQNGFRVYAKRMQVCQQSSTACPWLPKSVPESIYSSQSIKIRQKNQDGVPNNPGEATDLNGQPEFEPRRTAPWTEGELCHRTRRWRCLDQSHTLPQILAER